MSRSVANVHSELLSLLPPGWVWPRGNQSLLAAILLAFAEELAEIEATAAAMMRETDPRAAVLCLVDFERVLGPDPCLADVAGQPTEERQRIAHSRWTARGGASIAYFLKIAEALGYDDITITEFRPFKFGLSAFGATWALGPRRNRFYWRVNVPGPRLSRFRFGAARFGADSFLRIARAESLECRLRRLKPSHTQLIFNYTGA